MSDTAPMQAVDIRAASSDWLMSCPVHGAINMAIQFGGDLGRSYCQDCFEEAVAGMAAKVTVTAKPGAPVPSMGEG